jgi:hypothetical protein
MKGVRILFIAAIASATILFPGVGFAQSAPDPGPEWNIRIEYRYTEGEEKKLNVADKVVRYGRNYHLIDRQPAVLESTLPAKRVYTWYIEGYIKEEEKARFEDEYGVVLKPVKLEMEHLVDKTIVFNSLKTNDVDSDAIPRTYDFEIKDAPSEGETVSAVLTRAGVHFEVEKYEGGDSENLPELYKAEVVYRGLVTYLESGYYEAKATYTTTEDLDGVKQYVVVATYAPDAAPGAINSGGGAGGSGSTGGAGDAQEPGSAEGGAIIPPIDMPQSGEGGDGGGTIISDNAVPQSSGKNSPASGFWNLIPVFIAIALAACCGLLIYQNHKRAMERKARREARRKATLQTRGLVDYD